jgi:hypothetical protein
MKKKCWFISALAVIFVFTLLPISFLNATPGNLIDFSNGLTDWTPYHTESVEDGALKVPGWSFGAGVWQQFDTSEKNLRFIFDVKPVYDAGRIVLDFELYNNTYDNPGYVDSKYREIIMWQYNPFTVNSWNHYTLNLSDLFGGPLPDYNKFWFKLGLFDTGNLAYFDNIVIEPIIDEPESNYARPLTPEDWVLMDLSIGQLLSHYGPTTEGFVKTLYDNILGRVPDEDGLNYWTDQLNNNIFTGSQIVEHFIFSDELGAKVEAMSNEEFITFLYNSFLSRTPDSEGFNSWVSYMNSGVSKIDTLRVFMDNEEWFNICCMFNVNP